MKDFGGGQEFITWDGEPVSRERPHGATVVVTSRALQGRRYLLLHRAHEGGPAREGDWAVFALEVPWGTEVVVDGEEHDRFEWVSFAEARRRCQPPALEASFLAGAGQGQ